MRHSNGTDEKQTYIYRMCFITSHKLAALQDNRISMSLCEIFGGKKAKQNTPPPTTKLHLHTTPTSRYSLVPVTVATRHHAYHDLPGEGSGPILLQHHFPVMAATRQDSVGPHTHPRGVLSDTHRVAIVGNASFGMLQFRVPQECYRRKTRWMNSTEFTSSFSKLLLIY